jgi:hypothetical protein
MSAADSTTFYPKVGGMQARRAVQAPKEKDMKRYVHLIVDQFQS